MKKIILSAAVAAMAFSTSAMAADKGIDIVTTGQAVVYYQTVETDGTNTSDLFSNGSSSANVGVQLNLDADLKNNFTFGSQISYIGTAGLAKNLVDTTRDNGGSATMQGSTQTANTTDNLALTKIFIAKKIGNTTVKIGRQELPKSLSPLAYSEGWNVFKNTFDAIVAVNTDIPDTVLVGAFVSGGTGNSDLTTVDDLQVANSSGLGTTEVGGAAYMITAQTTVIPMTTLTASYYKLNSVDAAGTNDIVANFSVAADAYWIDAQIAPKDAPMGLNLGLQTGNIDPETKGGVFTDTTAYGAKLAGSVDAISAYLAYTDVDGATKAQVAIKNTGTGDKTPLYTQMVLTEDSASLDAQAWVAAVSYNMGDMGSVTARYGMVDTGANGMLAAACDEAEFDLIYSAKLGGVNYFAAYVNQDRDYVTGTTDTDTDVIRVWARYNF